ncbi:hypothetical protein DPMN_168534 [Dreissena polymorpha]|uniref:Uncharacterized protein n=1 Tax=Dreissena polymorpha TaxID=45954 RepID=A0A9D4F2U4_DREPO|nr:hypothetical protein DPMN_168534 [Dreissena polymorpha]
MTCRGSQLTSGSVLYKPDDLQRTPDDLGTSMQYPALNRGTKGSSSAKLMLKQLS